jgi:hypothetical protein
LIFALATQKAVVMILDLQENTGRDPWGAGIIPTTPTSTGEGSWDRRTGIFLHGSAPWVPEQGLSPTLGCIKLLNKDIISLIGLVRRAEVEGDKLDNIYAGSEAYLRKLAEQKDSKGRYLNPEFREYVIFLYGSIKSPVLKFQDVDPYAAYEPPLDDDDESGGDDDDFKYGDDEDEVEETISDDEVVQPPSDYG